MTPPPLAVWLMESFRAEVMRAGLGPVGSTPWCPEWVVFEDQDDALLSLHGVKERERSAAAWVDWGEDHAVRLSVIADDDAGPRRWTGTPAELVRWLRGVA